MVAVLTDMEQPLGNMVGNALEVRKAMDTLRGQGALGFEGTLLHLAAEMILLGEKAGTFEAAMSQAVDMLSSERLRTNSARWWPGRAEAGMKRSPLTGCPGAD